ncbi:hypothetical protein GCM10022221_67940 [Actinocorallia aurea]
MQPQIAFRLHRNHGPMNAIAFLAWLALTAQHGDTAEYRRTDRSRWCPLTVRAYDPETLDTGSGPYRIATTGDDHTWRALQADLKGLPFGEEFHTISSPVFRP